MSMRGEQNTETDSCLSKYTAHTCYATRGDYRGPVTILNHSDIPFHIDRITQLLIECIHCPDTILVEELPETRRGVESFHCGKLNCGGLYLLCVEPSRYLALISGN